MKNKILTLALISILTSCAVIDFEDQQSNEIVQEIKKENTLNKTTVAETRKDFLIPNKYALMNTSWKLMSFNEDVINSNHNVTITFKNNLFSHHDLLINGSTGCNSYQTTGSVNHVLEKLEVEKNILMTNFKCQDSETQLIEQRFLNYIVDNKKIEQLDINTLRLSGYRDFVILKKM